MNITLSSLYDGFREIIRHKLKLLCTCLFLLSCFYARTYLMNLFNSFTNILSGTPFTPILPALINVIITITLILLFLEWVIIVGKPLLIGNTHEKFMRIGLCNQFQETPSIIKKRKDPYKKHGIIYTIDTKGIGIKELDNAVPKLQSSFDLVIYNIQYSEKSTKLVEVSTIKKKFFRPTQLLPNDDLLANALNCLVVGATNSGKSFCLLVLLSQASNYISNLSITICDYKNASFVDFSDAPNYYGYTDCVHGIRKVYEEFTQRLKFNSKTRNEHIQILLIDEYNSLLSSLDKTTEKEIKTMVGSMLCMGRSLGIRIFLGMQRAQATYFENGVRDNLLNIICLGNPSSEQKSMLFSDYKDQMHDFNKQRQGYMFRDGIGFERIEVAKVEQIEPLYERIKEKMYN